MLDLATAQAHRLDKVIYDPGDGSPVEEGVITRVGPRIVFVRYGDDPEPRGTDPAALTLAAGRCPDGGACHHLCPHSACFRVQCCEPLSGVFPGDRWPGDVRHEHGPRVWFADDEPGTSPVIDMGYMSLPAEVQAAVEATLTVTVPGIAAGDPKHDAFCARLAAMYDRASPDATVLLAALGVALELHQPRRRRLFRPVCGGCDQFWPCTEYEAIRRVILGEDGTDGH